MKLQRPRRRASVCGAAVCVLLIAGCSSAQEKVTGQFEVATDQVVSAGQSAELALSQYRAGTTLSGAADTALEDALTDIASEQSEASALDVSTSQQRALQRHTTRAVDRVAEAVSGARAALQQDAPTQLQDAQRNLRAATRSADAWATKLGKGAP